MRHSILQKTPLHVQGRNVERFDLVRNRGVGILKSQLNPKIAANKRSLQSSRMHVMERDQPMTKLRPTLARTHLYGASNAS